MLRTSLLRLLCGAPLFVTALSPALADVPGKDWISQARAKQIIAKRGAMTTAIEADDGHWEGKATKNGVRYEFHVDPHTGAITKWERDTD